MSSLHVAVIAQKESVEARISGGTDAAVNRNELHTHR